MRGPPFRAALGRARARGSFALGLDDARRVLHRLRARLLVLLRADVSRQPKESFAEVAASSYPVNFKYVPDPGITADALTDVVTSARASPL